jgi:hypothetical protein
VRCVERVGRLRPATLLERNEPITRTLLGVGGTVAYHGLFEGGDSLYGRLS